MYLRRTENLISVLDYQLPQWDAFHYYITMALINLGMVIVTGRFKELASNP
jgi:hypothetical protein